MRTCILLWILYGNMVDFSFIVSLYVSDLPNVTISTVHYTGYEYCMSGRYEYSTSSTSRYLPTGYFFFVDIHAL